MKANIHEIAQTFRTAYPNAKVLYPGKEDFSPENRVRIMREMQNNDWDAIILSHEQFGMIPNRQKYRYASFRKSWTVWRKISKY